jgi:hypothetical protein
MNLKVANLVGIQFGIFVGLISWLAYSRLESDEPRPAPEMQESAPAQNAPAAPTREPRDQRSQTADYRTDREEARPATEQLGPAVLHEYSAAAVQRYSALAAQQYYQQIAPRPIAAADAPSNAKVDQAPSVAPVEYVAEPEPIAYAQPTQVVVYPQPQFVVFSNRHRFAKRCRPASHPRGRRTTFAHQRLDREGPRPDECEAASPRSNGAPSCQPAHRFRPREKR